MGSLSQYVPQEGNNSSNENSGYPRLVPLLFYGDQMTVERTRSAMVLQSFHNLSIDRLEGFVPAIADWHARKTLVKVNNYIAIC